MGQSKDYSSLENCEENGWLVMLVEGILYICIHRAREGLFFCARSYTPYNYPFFDSIPMIVLPLAYLTMFRYDDLFGISYLLSFYSSSSSPSPSSSTTVMNFHSAIRMLIHAHCTPIHFVVHWIGRN